MGERTINFGADATDADYQIRDSDPAGGDLIMEHLPTGATFEYDATENAWVPTDPIGAAARQVPGTSHFNAVSTAQENLTEEVIRAYPGGSVNYGYEDYKISDYSDLGTALNQALFDVPQHGWAVEVIAEGDEPYTASGTIDVKQGYGKRNRWSLTGRGLSRIEYTGTGNMLELGSSSWFRLGSLFLDGKGNAQDIINMTDGNMSRYRFHDLNLQDWSRNSIRGTFDNYQFAWQSIEMNQVDQQGSGQNAVHARGNWHNFSMLDVHAVRFGGSYAFDFEQARRGVAQLAGQTEDTVTNTALIRVGNPRNTVWLSPSIEASQQITVMELGNTATTTNWRRTTILNPTATTGTSIAVDVKNPGADATQSVATVLHPSAGDYVDWGQSTNNGEIHLEPYIDARVLNDSAGKVTGTAVDGRTVMRDPDDGTKYVADPSAGGWSTTLP